MQNDVDTHSNQGTDCVFMYTSMNIGRKKNYEPVKWSVIVLPTFSRPSAECLFYHTHEYGSFIV